MRVSTAVVAFAVGSVLLVGVPASAGPTGGWTPQQELWKVGGSSTQVAVGTSGNGQKSTILSAGKYSDWTGSSWAKGKKMPGADEMYAPSVQWDLKGKRTLAIWDGESNEGVADLYRSVRTKGKWKTQMYGAGNADAHLSPYAKMAISAWYEVDEEDGTSTNMYVSLWDGSWSLEEDLAAPVGDLATSGAPRVAADGQNDEAVVTWVQNANLYVSFWNGAGWGAPSIGAPGRQPLDVVLLPGGSAAILTSRDVGVAQQDIEVALVTPGGPVVFPAAPVGSTFAYRATGVEGTLSDDGGSGLVSYSDLSTSPASRTVATWSPTDPFDAFGFGDVNLSAALSSSGGSALATYMPSANAEVGNKVQVRTWNGATWSSPKKIGTCKSRQTASDVSAGGVMVAGWACTHIHVTRSPKVPGKIKGLSVKAKGSKAVATWKAAKNATSYGYRIKGPKNGNEWLTTNKTRVTFPIKRKATYTFSIRGQNNGGVGPVKKLTL